MAAPQAGPSSLSHPHHPQHHPQHQHQHHPHQHPTAISPHLTTVNPNQQPIIAQPGEDWTKNLVHLARTAELKKHALTLQLHTAHILSAHASLEARNRALQDVKEQKNRLESERNRLVESLRLVNEDRAKTEQAEQSLTKECADLRNQIQSLTEGEYTAAKRDVDRLRAELGQPALPSLQATLEERSAAFLAQQRRKQQTQAQSQSQSQSQTPSTQATNPTSSTSASTQPKKRLSKGPEGEPPPVVAPGTDGEPPAKRPRGRPKGSKNKIKPPAEGQAPLPPSAGL